MPALPRLLGLLGALSAAQLNAQFLSPPGADSSVRTLITRLSARDTLRIVLPMDLKQLANQGISRDSLLHMLMTGFDIGRVERLDLIDRTDFHPFNSTRVDEQLTYHAIGERDSRLVFVVAATDSGRTLLTGIRWQPDPADLGEMNPFKLAGKSWLHYVFLSLAVLIPLFSLGTAVAAVISRTRLKWLWAIGSLLSIGKLTIVWTDSSAGTALVRFMPLQVQLLGAGILKYPLYAPWVISISLPAIAIAYWVVRARRKMVHSIGASPVAA